MLSINGVQIKIDRNLMIINILFLDQYFVSLHFFVWYNYILRDIKRYGNLENEIKRSKKNDKVTGYKI